MISLNGKYNNAKIFTDNVDAGTISQIIELCNQEFTKDSNIRIMPDCHVGAGCTIGTTMTITDKVVPNLVGVDIGCGVLCHNLGEIAIDFEKLDDFIKMNIPHGFDVNKKTEMKGYSVIIDKIRCIKEISKSSNFFERSLGSLGGGIILSKLK